MTNPLVSIIVPVYNAQKGLSRCLESICSQTYQELEIIVLNDGSTDDSLAICEQFRAKDPRLVVVDKENEGVSRTRNAGLALAQGDYIQFADSDDVLDPDYTQNLVQAALQHSADLVIAPYWMVIPSNSSKTGHALETLQESLGIEPEAPKTEVHKYGFLPQGVYSREDYARRLMQQPASFYYGVLWNKLYRREIIAENQLGFAPDVHWAEDLLFNMGVSRTRGGVRFHPRCRVSLYPEPQKHLPHPDRPARDRGEQNAGLSAVQGGVHPPWTVRGAAAPDLQIPVRLFGKRCALGQPAGRFAGCRVPPERCLCPARALPQKAPAKAQKARPPQKAPG